MFEKYTKSDTEIWRAFQDGERQGFEQLLKLYYPLLLNYGIRFVSSKDFAKDCLQDFFIDLWSRRERLESPINIKAYLMTSYRRFLFNEKKRSFWHQKVVDIDENANFEIQLNIESYLINNEIEHETLLKLKHYLSTLSKRQREVIYLRFEQELEYEEISNIMNINAHSAVNLVYEALKILRKNWVMVALLPMIIL